MANEVDTAANLGISVGSKIRALRKIRGISLQQMAQSTGMSYSSGCRKSGLRHFFEVFIAPLRLRRGQGAMQGNPCYARLFADLTRMSPNPIKASGGYGPRTPGGFSTG